LQLFDCLERLEFKEKMKNEGEIKDDLYSSEVQKLMVETCWLSLLSKMVFSLLKVIIFSVLFFISILIVTDEFEKSNKCKRLIFNTCGVEKGDREILNLTLLIYQLEGNK
jgi:hypothetical protein